MMGNPLFVDTMNAMGGNGIAMGYGEVFTAPADRRDRRRREQPAEPDTANHFKAGEVLHPDRPPDHSRDPGHVEGHLRQAARPPSRRWSEMAREAQLEQRKMWDEQVANYATKLKAAGAEFIEVDNKSFQSMHRAGARQVRRAVRRPEGPGQRGEVGRLCLPEPLLRGSGERDEPRLAPLPASATNYPLPRGGQRTPKGRGRSVMDHPFLRLMDRLSWPASGYRPAIFCMSLSSCGGWSRATSCTDSPWAEPIAILLVMFVHLLGAAAAYRAGAHRTRRW